MHHPQIIWVQIQYLCHYTIGYHSRLILCLTPTVNVSLLTFFRLLWLDNVLFCVGIQLMIIFNHRFIPQFSSNVRK